MQFAHAHEGEVSIARTDELHAAEADAGAAAGIGREDDLIRRQRHPESVREQDERAQWTVADDRQRRGTIFFTQEEVGSTNSTTSGVSTRNVSGPFRWNGPKTQTAR